MAEDCKNSRSLRPRNIVGWVMPPSFKRKSSISSNDNTDMRDSNKDSVSKEKVVPNIKEVTKKPAKKKRVRSSQVVDDTAATPLSTFNFVVPNDDDYTIKLPTVSQVSPMQPSVSSTRNPTFDFSTTDYIFKLFTSSQMSSKMRVIYYGCSDCNAQFHLFESLNNHIKFDHKEPPYKCLQLGCQKSFNELNEYTAHINRQHNLPASQSYTCSKCENTFNSYQSLVNHDNYYHQNGLFQCIFCIETFPNLASLTLHNMDCHNFLCKSCFQVLPSLNDLKVHLNCNHSESEEQPTTAISSPPPVVKKLRRKLRGKLTPCVQETDSKVLLSSLKQVCGNVVDLNLAKDKDKFSSSMKRKVENKMNKVAKENSHLSSFAEDRANKKEKIDSSIKEKKRNPEAVTTQMDKPSSQSNEDEEMSIIDVPIHEPSGQQMFSSTTITTTITSADTNLNITPAKKKVSKFFWVSPLSKKN